MDPAGTSKTAFLDTEPFSFSQALSFENESSKITDFCMFRCIIICVHIFIVQTLNCIAVSMCECIIHVDGYSQGFGKDIKSVEVLFLSCCSYVICPLLTVVSHIFPIAVHLLRVPSPPHICHLFSSLFPPSPCGLLQMSDHTVYASQKRTKFPLVSPLHIQQERVLCAEPKTTVRNE